MSEQDTLPPKPKKFLFDANNFDDDYVEEIIEEEPPPPTYNEEELESARNHSFSEGKRAGLAEAEASREKYVSVVLDTISKNFQTLFSAEQKRSEQFEAEAVILARAIFNKLFPGLNEHHGLAEVERIIVQTLESQATQPEIVIEVAQDDVEDIKQSLEFLKSTLRANGQFIVQGGEDLGPGDCRLYWNDGGGIRDVSGLAEQIDKHLQQTLEGKASLQDNRKTAIEAESADLPEDGAPETMPTDTETGEADPPITENDDE